MSKIHGDVPYGTLDLMILKTLEREPLHGFALARRIEQVSENLVTLNQGSVYPALVRLQQRGWIKASWGTSVNNRRAKYYALTTAGRKQVRSEVEDWMKTVELMARFLAVES